ncbi:MAG: hypothetical protein WDN10_00505 [bacterium]
MSIHELPREEAAEITLTTYGTIWLKDSRNGQRAGHIESGTNLSMRVRMIGDVSWLLVFDNDIYGLRKEEWLVLWHNELVDIRCVCSGRPQDYFDAKKDTIRA